MATPAQFWELSPLARVDSGMLVSSFSSDLVSLVSLDQC